MDRNPLPLLALMAAAIVIVTGLLNAFDTLAVPEPTAGPAGPGVACEISPEGGVHPHDSLFIVRGAEHTAYLREKVTTRYDLQERMWQLPDDRPWYDYEGETLALRVPVPAKEVVQDEIYVSPAWKPYLEAGYIPTSLHTIQVSHPSPLTYYPEEGVFLSHESAGSYSFFTFHWQFDLAILRQAEAADDPTYLQLPEGLDGRIGDLARSVTAGLDSPYEKAEALETYLQSNYFYDEFYQRALGEEPNCWFLFEEKKGVCANFNSAFVILCRSVGVPARLVSGYRITPQVSEQTVYADQAHAWAEIALDDLGWITFDATGSRSEPGPLPPKPTLTEIEELATSSDVLMKGNSFTVKGTVMSLDPYSVYEQRWETEDGPTHSVHGVIVMDTESKPVASIEVVVCLSKHKMSGVPWSWGDDDSDPPMASGEYLVGRGKTSSEGRFEITCNIPTEATAGHYHVQACCLGNEEYADSLSDPEIDIFSDTSVAIELPQDVQVGKPAQIFIALREEPGYLVPVSSFDWERNWNLVSSQEIRVFIDGQLFEAGNTGKGGTLSLEYTFEEVRTYEIKAVFQGSEYHLASTGTTSVSLHPFPWFYLAIPMGLGAIAAAYLLYRRRSLARLEFVALVAATAATIACAAYGLRGMTLYPWIYVSLAPLAALGLWMASSALRRPRQRMVLVAGEALPDEQLIAVPVASVPVPSAVEARAARAGKIAIELPQIEEGLPDVWGLDDELLIHLSMKHQDGSMKPPGDAEVYIDSLFIGRTHIDQEHNSGLAHAFRSKGRYMISASLGKLRGERLIRIVDYREEIVDLFNAMLSKLRSRGVDIPQEATPREIQQRILESQPGIDQCLLDDIIGCFEEADYSRHPMNRRHYVTMYLSQKAILGEE